MLDHDWFPASLPANVTIGSRSWCYSSFAFVHCRSEKRRAVRVGDDSGIYNGTFFDLGPDGQVEIGHHCAIVGAIFSTNARITVGDYSFISHDVVLADSFAAVPFAPGQSRTDETVIAIGTNCWIGARAVLLAGAKIGDNSIVGAAAVVDFEVPAGATVAGNPARVVRKTRVGRSSSGTLP